MWENLEVTYDQILFMFSDASYIACGSYVVKANYSGFHSNEKVKSSTFRKLQAVIFDSLSCCIK